jgi:hypothetical protein
VTRWFGAAASGWIAAAPGAWPTTQKKRLGEDLLQSLVQLSLVQLSLDSSRSPRAGEATPVETIGAA